MHKTLLILLLPLALVACTDRQQEAAEADAEQAVGVLDAAGEQFRTEAQQAATEADRQIEALEREAADETGEVRERYNAALNEAREYRTEIQADLDRIATVEADDFDDLREDILEKQAHLDGHLAQAKLEVAATKAEFEAAAQSRLAALDRDIERFSARVAQSTGEAQNEATESLNKLREERRELDTHMTGFASATDANFRSAGRSLADGLRDLDRDLDGAMNRLAERAIPGS